MAEKPMSQEVWGPNTYVITLAGIVSLGPRGDFVQAVERNAYLG